MQVKNIFLKKIHDSYFFFQKKKNMTRFFW